MGRKAQKKAGISTAQGVLLIENVTILKRGFWSFLRSKKSCRGFIGSHSKIIFILLVIFKIRGGVKILSTRAKDIFKEINIPKNRIIVLHARLKNIKDMLEIDYTEATKAILDSIYELYQPKTILVPTYTYSFTKSGIYHRLFSKSEVGRFSEEARKIYSQYRTPDPIFSFVDTNNIIHKYNIDYCTAFDKGSLFELLDKEDCIVLNADLDHIIQTQIHYVEKVNQVDYRYEKIFKGVVYHDERSWDYINYKYYVRDLMLNPKMNFKKREHYLIKNGYLKLCYNNNFIISWISANILNNAITKALKDDPHFLIFKQDG